MTHKIYYIRRCHCFIQNIPSHLPNMLPVQFESDIFKPPSWKRTSVTRFASISVFFTSSHLGSMVGLCVERIRPLLLPVSWCHRWEAVQANEQLLCPGGDLRPWLRCLLHRCSETTVIICSFWLEQLWDSNHLSRSSAFSLCCRGNVYFLWNRPVPELDVLLWFCGDVHVLLRPVADLRVRDNALWPVSTAFVCVFKLTCSAPPRTYGVFAGLTWRRCRSPSSSYTWYQRLEEWACGKAR